ncbi:hypothetical protein FQN54_007590 [Arachnomyces sp. PD_36]|nr:hypothetical protein FQN54_007590 [Arachnomyces sp. PD_36]
MQLPSPNLGRIKTILHAVQAFVIFLAWAFTIAVFTREGATDGRTGWYFGLCWLSIPALIYLVGVPIWPRARRFGNAYAFAFLDILFTLFWFSAWVAVASYVAAGKSAGPGDTGDDDEEDDSEDNKEGKSGCDAFGYGSPGKCKLSTGTVILGVVIFLLFVATSYLSIRNVQHYRRTGTMPDAPTDPSFAAQSQAAFSSNPAHDFDDDDDRHDHLHHHDGLSSTGGLNSMGDPERPSRLGRRDDDDEYALLHQSELDDGHGGAPGAYDPTATSGGGLGPGGIVPPPAGSRIMHDYDTSYGGPYGGRYNDSEFGGSQGGYGR